MEGSLTIEQIRQVYNAAPFRPFIVHLADGREIPVKHREFTAISPSGRIIVVYQSDDTSNIIDLLLVTGLEVRDGEAPQLSAETGPRLSAGVSTSRSDGPLA